jgi:2,3-bisphosphoglycerate-independent phosphoglycerate mutase
MAEGADAGRLPSAGILADVAPTILELLGVPAPEAMTGRSLLRHAGDGASAP